MANISLSGLTRAFAFLVFLPVILAAGYATAVAFQAKWWPVCFAMGALAAGFGWTAGQFARNRPLF